MRWNTAKGFLRPVAHRRNLTVETDAHGRAAAARRQARHRPRRCASTASRARVRAAREVILAAGAIGSPQILQLSGIGPGAVLQPLGIEVRHELDGRRREPAGPPADPLRLQGAGREDHERALPEPRCSAPALPPSTRLPRRGPMTMAPSQLGAFVKSDPSRDTPNLQYHVQPLTLPKFGEPLDPFPAFTASVANIRPTSRGWVRITAPDPAAHPEIRPNYLVHRGRPPRGGRRRARDAQHRLHAGAGEVSARGVPPRPRVPERRGAGARPPATSPPPSSTPSAPARWAATTAPWSIHGSRCAACRACASPTPRSCRPSRRATPTRRR